jgi:hypothetical protein
MAFVFLSPLYDKELEERRQKNSILNEANA